MDDLTVAGQRAGVCVGRCEWSPFRQGKDIGALQSRSCMVCGRYEVRSQPLPLRAADMVWGPGGHDDWGEP